MNRPAGFYCSAITLFRYRAMSPHGAVRIGKNHAPNITVLHQTRSDTLHCQLITKQDEPPETNPYVDDPTGNARECPIASLCLLYIIA